MCDPDRGVYKCLDSCPISICKDYRKAQRANQEKKKKSIKEENKKRKKENFWIVWLWNRIKKLVEMKDFVFSVFFFWNEGDENLSSKRL